MFNLDEQQWRVIRFTAASAFACWLASQIADSSLAERVWHQAAIFAVAAGALRAWTLDGAKPKRA